MASKERYSVQFVVIREIEVEATDDLQAERLAFQKLKANDAESAIALKVFDIEDNDPGALADDQSDAWRFAREQFHSLDREWVM